MHGVLAGGPAREAECRALLNSTGHQQNQHRPLDHHHHHRADDGAAQPTAVKIMPYTENTLLCAMSAAGVSYPWFGSGSLAQAERGRGSDESACRLATNSLQPPSGPISAPDLHHKSVRSNLRARASSRATGGRGSRTSLQPLADTPPGLQSGSQPASSLSDTPSDTPGSRQELVLSRLRALQSPPPERCENLTRLAAYWNGGLAATFHVRHS